MTNFCTILNSPLGDITIIADATAVNEITFSKRETSQLTSNEITQAAAEQLNAYFEGQLQTFAFPIAQTGTAFQQVVWKELININYGETTSYLKFSNLLNNPLAIRAIAAANGKNHIAIVVPCHRVIGSNGKLVGYAGELWRKKWLLDHERSICGKGQTTLIF